MHSKVISCVWKVKLSKRNNGCVIWGSKDGAKFFSVQAEWTKVNEYRWHMGNSIYTKHEEKEEEKNGTFLLWGWGSTGLVSQRGCRVSPSFADIQNPSEGGPGQTDVLTLLASAVPGFWSWLKVMGQSHNKDYFSLGKKKSYQAKVKYEWYSVLKYFFTTQALSGNINKWSRLVPDWQTCPAFWLLTLSGFFPVTSLRSYCILTF